MRREPTIQDVLDLVQGFQTEFASSMRNVREELRDSVLNLHEAIQLMAEHLDERFSIVEGEIGQVKQQVGMLDLEMGGMKTEMGGMKMEMGSMKSRMDHLDSRMDHLDSRMGSMESKMVTKADLQRVVTKEYLDEKMADLRGDLVLLSRKSNTKLSVLVQELVDQKALDWETARKILALEPFPQMS